MLGNLFRIEPGKCNRANLLIDDVNGVPYLGATNRNNAVLNFVKADDSLLQKGNCIAFIKDGEGSMGYSVYKHESFISTVNIALGYAPFVNEYTGLFISTVADKVRGKYNFNYKRNEERLKKEILQLPVDSSGNPDYKFMEDYMKSLEHEILLSYLNLHKNS